MSQVDDETSQPDVEMLQHSDGSWALEARDLGSLRAGLGPDLLLALCRFGSKASSHLPRTHNVRLVRWVGLRVCCTPGKPLEMTQRALALDERTANCVCSYRRPIAAPGPGECLG